MYCNPDSHHFYGQVHVGRTFWVPSVNFLGVPPFWPQGPRESALKREARSGFGRRPRLGAIETWGKHANLLAGLGLTNETRKTEVSRITSQGTFPFVLNPTRAPETAKRGPMVSDRGSFWISAKEKKPTGRLLGRFMQHEPTVTKWLVSSKTMTNSCFVSEVSWLFN